MTRQRKLKALVRERMDRTGESYTTARRHVLNARPGSRYELRGGIHPETAACANAFANRGIDDPTTGEPISEALVLGVGGGLGAGYILWQFAEHDRRVVTTGFRNQWQYPQRWYAKVCERLGVDVEIHETAGARRAAQQLDAALAEGVPAIAAVSAADLPYWHLPADEAGWYGYPLVVHGRDDGRYLVDDRNLGVLTVEAEALAQARARIPSYSHRLVVADPAATELAADRLRAAVLAGLDDQLSHLGSSSSSFSLPAFTKWRRMLTSETNDKGWPRVFADGRGLLGALVSTHESVDEVGILGGNLRRLYADFLDEASRIVDVDLSAAAAAYREAAAAWAGVPAVCEGVPAVAAVVAADRERRAAVRRGDAGDGDASAAAARSARLLDDDRLDLDGAARAELFGRLSAALEVVEATEATALARVADAVEG